MNSIGRHAAADSGRSWPADRHLHVSIRLALFAAGCAMPLLTALLAKFPHFIERAYTNTLGTYLPMALARVSGLVPFSVAEFGAYALLSVAVFFSTRGIVFLYRRERHTRNAAVCALLWSGSAIGILVVLGYVFWGFNFARADLVTRLHWSAFTDARGDPAEELALYSTKLVELANHEFELAVGSRDPGRPSMPPDGMDRVDAAIEEGYARLTHHLDLDPLFGRKRGRAKPVLASFVMSAALVGGFYSPWTGEANYNRELPASELPHAVAHEKAHQRGITSEDEANFFGFLACLYAPDHYARYSACLFAQQQLLGELVRIDAARVRDLAGRRDPGVQRDVEEARRFVMSHRGAVSRADSALINAYLKANRVPGGIRSYALSSRLIVIYTRAVKHPFEVVP